MEHSLHRALPAGKQGQANCKFAPFSAIFHRRSANTRKNLFRALPFYTHLVNIHTFALFSTGCFREFACSVALRNSKATINGTAVFALPCSLRTAQHIRLVAFLPIPQKYITAVERRAQATQLHRSYDNFQHAADAQRSVKKRRQATDKSADRCLYQQKLYAESIVWYTYIPGSATRRVIFVTFVLYTTYYSLAVV